MSARTFSGHIDWQFGHAWVWMLGYGIQIRAPWRRKLFSERYGLERGVYRVGFGWRVCFKRLRNIGT